MLQVGKENLMAKSYFVTNGPMPTTASPASVTTGTAIKTLLQLKPAANFPISIVEWGISFDSTTAATPGNVCLIDTLTVYSTVTAFAVSDIMPFKDPYAPANTAGVSGVPLNLGTTASGYTASTEGTVAGSRLLDCFLISPTGQFFHQFPLGERPEVIPGNFLRVRATFAAAVNALAYIVFEV